MRRHIHHFTHRHVVHFLHRHEPKGHTLAHLKSGIGAVVAIPLPFIGPIVGALVGGGIGFFTADQRR